MKKSRLHYYENFELDMNIRCGKHELVTMVDTDDCIDCHQLRVQNIKKTSLKRTKQASASTSSDSSVPSETDKKFNDAFHMAAPSAGSLPKPRWPGTKTSSKRKKSAPEIDTLDSVMIWVRASIPHITQSISSFPVPRKVLDQINYSWPPFPESIWSDETLRVTTTREQILRGEQEGDVDSSVMEFFDYFEKKRAVPKPAFG